MTTSPPKAHNFDAIPTVHALDEFFHRKYAEDETPASWSRSPTAEEIMAEQEAQRRAAHPHAVAVVLADRARLRPAGDRHRPDLQPPRHRRRRGDRPARRVRLGPGAVGRRRQTTTTRRPTWRARRSWRPLADIAIPATPRRNRSTTMLTAATTTATTAVATATTPRRAVEQQARRCGCSSARSACCSAG